MSAELQDAELEELQRSGVASAGLAAWVRAEQAQQRAAEAKYEGEAVIGSLFACSSDSSSEEDADEGGTAALQTARWRGPRQSGVEVCYALARGAAFGHGDEVWAAAIYLAERLCDPESRRALLPAPARRASSSSAAALGGYRIVELGAGCAIPSWVCSQLGAEVAASDYPSLPSIAAMLRGALLNAELRGPDAGAIEVVGHAWGADVVPLLSAARGGSAGETEGAAAGGEGGRFDVAIACDCIYDPSGHSPLLRTLCAALRPGGRALVAFSLHGNVDDQAVLAFFEGAAACGFAVEHTSAAHRPLACRPRWP